MAPPLLHVFQRDVSRHLRGDIPHAPRIFLLINKFTGRKPERGEKLVDYWGDKKKVATAIRNVAAKMPTYITLKDEEAVGPWTGRYFPCRAVGKIVERHDALAGS